MIERVKQAVAGFLGVSACYFALSIYYGLKIDSLKQEQAKAIIEQIENCKTAQKSTKDANDDLQKKYAVIRNRLAESERMQQLPNCVVADNAEPGAVGHEHAGSNGLSISWLKAYSAQCESYRQERITLEALCEKHGCKGNEQ